MFFGWHLTFLLRFPCREKRFCAFTAECGKGDNPEFVLKMALSGYEI